MPSRMRTPRYLVEITAIVQIVVFGVGAMLLAGQGRLSEVSVTFAVSAVSVLATCIAAVIVSRRRRSVPYAWVLLSASGVFPLAALLAGAFGWTSGAAVVARSFIPILTVLVIVTFDTGRATTWIDRRITVPGLVVQAMLLVAVFAVAPRVPSGVVAVQCDFSCGGGWLGLDSAAAGDAVSRAYIVVKALVLLAMCAGVISRLRSLRGSRRTEFAYLGVTALVWVAIIMVQSGVQMVDLDPGAPMGLMYGVQVAVRILLPFALLMGLMLGEWRRGSTLGVEFSRIRSSADPDELRGHLRGLLEDPSLEIVPAPDTVAGGVADRGITEMRSADGRLLGTLVHQPRLESDLPVSYAVAVPAATAAMERMDVARQMGQLEADVADARRQAQAAGDAERARIERDLHDGAQARIVVLRSRVSRLARQEDGAPGVSDSLRSLDTDLAALLAEVRVFGSGLRPLTPGTLEASLRDHASELPMSVSLGIDPLGDLPEHLELAVYFCVREALQNAMKHGGPHVRARVDIRRDGGTLEFVVQDDGPGPGAADGGGIRGMRQRMQAVGGVLDVGEAPGGGTLVRGRAGAQVVASPRDDR